MTDAADLTPEDVANALAFALRYKGRTRYLRAGEIMAEIVAERLVEHLEDSGFVIMKKPPSAGAARSVAGFKGDERATNEISDC